MRIKHVFFLICIMQIWVSCKKEEGAGNEESTEQSSAALSALEKEMLVLQDSIISYREKAFALEEEKINSTAALIDEVENVVSGYNAATLNAIQDALEKMQSLRYDKKSLGNESVMLAYDAACDELLSHLNTLARETEEFNKYVRANLLISDIIEANNQDLFVRKDYNNYVKEYNEKLRDHNNELESIDNPQISEEKYPLFYGEPTS